MKQVFRCYAEKRPGYDVKAQQTLHELKEQLGLSGLEGLRIFCRYDVEGIDRDVFLRSTTTVFSEPMCDDFYEEALPAVEHCLYWRDLWHPVGSPCLIDSIQLII